MGLTSVIRIAAALLLLAWCACDVGVYGESQNNVNNGPDGGGDELPLTFNGAISNEMDTAGCLVCHNDPPAISETVINTYALLVAYVNQADPTASQLLLEMDPAGPATEDHIPYVNQTRYDLFLSWIEAGAPQ